MHSTLMERHRRFQLNGAERNVEFVVAPQHETSCDPEITTKEDADHRRKLIWFLQAKRS